MKLDIASYVREARFPEERADWGPKVPSALGKSGMVELAMSFDADEDVKKKETPRPSY